VLPAYTVETIGKVLQLFKSLNTSAKMKLPEVPAAADMQTQLDLIVAIIAHK
jgi:hypothetical protein